MTSRDFAFWLQGLFELHNPTTLDERQTRLIKQHLTLVFIHEIDPSHSDDPKVQGALQAVHDGLDVNELRAKLEALQNFDPSSLEKRVAHTEHGPQAVDGPGAVTDTLTPLPEKRLKELEAEVKKATQLAKRAINRPTPRSGGDIRYTC